MHILLLSKHTHQLRQQGSSVETQQHSLSFSQQLPGRCARPEYSPELTLSYLNCILALSIELENVLVVASAWRWCWWHVL